MIRRGHDFVVGESHQSNRTIGTAACRGMRRAVGEVAQAAAAAAALVVVFGFAYHGFCLCCLCSLRP